MEPAKQAVAMCSSDCIERAKACAPQATETDVPAPNTANTDTFDVFEALAFDEATAVAFELFDLAIILFLNQYEATLPHHPDRD